MLIITFLVLECLETSKARGIKSICSAWARIFTALAIHAFVFAFGAMFGRRFEWHFTLNYSGNQ
jgi:hypothetical protein